VAMGISSSQKRMLTLNPKQTALAAEEVFSLSDHLEAIRADQNNFLDETEDEVKEVAASTDVDEAVEAITAHINKYDVREQDERA
jgi:hypothetical protein